MNSLYAQYVKERENVEILESDSYFITYKINGNEIYIKDIFIVEELRHTQIARQIADQVLEIGKNSGCKYLLGSVCPTANGSDVSVKILQSYGMKLLKSCENIIYFVKEIH